MPGADEYQRIAPIARPEQHPRPGSRSVPTLPGKQAVPPSEDFERFDPPSTTNQVTSFDNDQWDGGGTNDGATTVILRVAPGGPDGAQRQPGNPEPAVPFVPASTPYLE